MTDSPIQVDPLSPVIGAEISGVDLSAPLPPEVFETLQLALMTHLVLFFRDQALSFEQHKAFGRHFGALHIHPAAPKGGDHPEILVVHGDATVKFVAGELWHSDLEMSGCYITHVGCPSGAYAARPVGPRSTQWLATPVRTAEATCKTLK